MHVSDWPDRKEYKLGKFVDLIEELVDDDWNSNIIHCKSGIGRAITLFSGVNVFHSIWNGEITESNMQEKINDILFDSRVARSTLSVNTDQRAMLVKAAMHWLSKYGSDIHLT